jgi:hypothetical protein
MVKRSIRGALLGGKANPFAQITFAGFRSNSLSSLKTITYIQKYFSLSACM